uniref:NADH:ubiquinone reductase (H(+)-translocating) n=1 Tax=Trichuris discolor TaxID=483153 RepID=J3S804_9BILA|nr:NADH dehydrogenase subunit 5 [Trichuris discolor]AFK81036.1 NADH dehydrogenase subunit 5 [Trichuris discolor]
MLVILFYSLLLVSMYLFLSFSLKGKLFLLLMNFNTFLSNLSLTMSSQLMFYFTSTVLFLSLVIFSFSFLYMNSDPPLNRFMLVLFIFILSMVILNNGNSIWTLWLGWEGLGISSYLLIMYYNNWKSNNSAMTTLLLNRIGDFCLLVSFLKFTQILLWTFENFSFTPLLILLILVAMIAKSAQMPLNSWLPIAMAAPTPVSSLVHSSTLVVAGTILCIKLNSYYFIYAMFLLSLLGFLTSFYASMMATLEKDLKKVLAYSTMSQIALVMFMLSTNLKELMIMHIINHAMVKALLFINVGNFILFMFGNQDTRILQSNNSLLMIIASSIICLIIMCGITFTSAYYSKEYSLLFSMKSETLLTVVNLMIFFSFAYSTRLVYLFLKSSNSMMIYSKSFHPSMLSSSIAYPIALINGWIFTYNYSLPLNNTWMSNKSTMLMIPLTITIFYLMFNSSLSFNNIDFMYTIMNNLTTFKLSMTNKMKSMTLSMNMTLMSYNNISYFPLILASFTVLLVTMILNIFL